jgi:glycosyltransferase involved in cell wall biosynthesis
MTERATGRSGVSIVIIAQDEEANIGACLASAAWADEVIVVDGGSRDRTPEIARSMGARVHHNPWPGFSAQWDLAIGRATCEWVFLLAADERVTPELAAQVRGIAARGGPLAGYYVRRQTYFLERAMRGCGWANQRELRLFRWGRGRMDGRMVHERLVVDGALGDLDGLLVHDSHPTVEDYLANLNRCTTLEAQEALALGVRRTWLPPVAPVARAAQRWWRSDRGYESARAALKDELKNRVTWAPLQPFAPLLRFLQMYVVLRGFRDGKHGFYLSLLSAVYVFVKQVKTWELGRSTGSTDQAAAATRRPADMERPAA